MFDVFYSGSKPNLFAHEQEARDLEHAQQLSRTRYFWWVNYLTDYTDWDFLWEPVPWESQFVHTWPSQHHTYSGTYLVPKHATQIEYRFHDHVLPNQARPDNFVQLVDGDIDFDWTWAPHPLDPPYIYVFGNQWHRAEIMPTVEYHVPGATERKYVNNPQAQLLPKHSDHWHVLIDCEWDYSWRPDPGDPPYVYVFGNQWYPAEIMPTVEYRVPGATDIKYMSYPRAQLQDDFTCWTIPDNTNRDAFDFSWRPDLGSPPYVYQFGTQWNRAGGPVYTVPGATDVKYTTVQTAIMLPTDNNWVIPAGTDINSFDFSWTPDPTEQPYVYVFGTQWQKTGGPEYHVPGARERKYVPQPRAVKTSKDSHWIIPDGADVESFDWTWHPDATEESYIYQFGTQHQRTGGPQYHVPGATEVKYVDQIRIRTQRVATAIVEIDHMDGNAGQIADTTRTVRYFDNYLDTLRRIAKNIGTEHEFVWICSSVCDYSNFDFSWHPEQWQATMLHVFASDGEKFGDTFFMHVPTFQYRSEKLQLLDWYDINFVGTTVPRRPLPVITHDYDTHVQAVKTIDWKGPLAVFAKEPVEQVPPVPLWREKTKTIVPLASGASQVIVPKVAVPYIRTQLYDYPHIDKTQRHLHDEQPLDIVFIDNGEPNAESNYRHMTEVVSLTWRNRIHRSSGVTGRVAAYHAAAELSTTPWFFAVFAKLQVNSDFDWLWQPDRMQEPKHYIFHARNPVNGLEYGHQAMIAYNKELVLANAGTGLDFTLDNAHEVVPILSGTAYYTDSAWMAWRTAFRECIKLKDSLPNVESQYRLNKWLQENNNNDRVRWSHMGAKDAVEYWEGVGGDVAELRKSYDWSWLASYAMIKHGLTPDQ
jgi:hypothetical protein